jgi:hypothetical protein
MLLLQPFHGRIALGLILRDKCRENGGALLIRGGFHRQKGHVEVDRASSHFAPRGIFLVPRSEVRRNVSRFAEIDRAHHSRIARRIAHQDCVHAGIADGHEAGKNLRLGETMIPEPNPLRRRRRRKIGVVGRGHLNAPAAARERCSRVGEYSFFARAERFEKRAARVRNFKWKAEAAIAACAAAFSPARRRSTAGRCDSSARRRSTGRDARGRAPRCGRRPRRRC